MTDTLISRLRGLPGIAVQPFTSVRRYGASDQDALVAARELGVASVLDGTIQRSGDRLRVTARLLKVADGAQLWSQQFDESFTDIFAVQDTIAARVTEALAIRLTGQADRRLNRRFTEDAEAYQLYVRLVSAQPRGRGRVPAIHRLLRKSHRTRSQTTRCPMSGSRTDTRCSGCLARWRRMRRFRVRSWPRTRRWSSTTNSGEAHTSLAHIKAVYERDIPGAEAEYQLALNLAPEYATAHMWYGLSLAWSGRYEEGIARLRKAQELEPLQLGTSANIGMLLYFSRHYDEAIDQLRKVLAVEPALDHARSFLGRAYLRKGDPAAALAEFALRKSLSVGSYADVGMALALAGRRTKRSQNSNGCSRCGASVMSRPTTSQQCRRASGIPTRRSSGCIARSRNARSCAGCSASILPSMVCAATSA